MTAPVQVCVEVPKTYKGDWAKEAQEWKDTNSAVGGCPDFYPLTIKAGYVVGVIHDICVSVSLLLGYQRARDVTYIPAYGVFASGVELLGRCISGNNGVRDSTQNLIIGFKWLKTSDYAAIDENDVYITTKLDSYSTMKLVLLRHFAAHGQATVDKTKYNLVDIDHEILEHMPPLITDGLERYWSKLQNNACLCETLARADILALRHWPVLKAWLLFGGPRGQGDFITNIFSKFNWHI